MVARVTITADQRELDRYLKKLEKLQGKPLADRAQRVTNAAARLAIPTIRAEAPSPRYQYGPGRHRPGNLKRRVHQRLLRKQAGELIKPTWLGSSAYYTRFVIEGTRPHSLAAKGGLVSFITRGGESVSFTKSTGGRSAFAAFPTGEVRPWSVVRHPGSSADDFVARAWSRTSGTVYARIERDIWDTA
jgi:hypothetical protein